MKDIKLTLKTDFIKLDQLLKYADIVSSGGEAKIIIKENGVKLNGTLVRERGTKVYKGDKIELEYNGEIYSITL